MSWYEDLAKKGLLGTRAQISAETGTADWSSKPEKRESVDPIEDARKKAIQSAMKLNDKGSQG